MNFQMTIAHIWMQLLSWNFVGILRVGIVYFGTNLGEIGQFFTKSIFGPKIVNSIFSQRARKDFLIYTPNQLPYLVGWFAIKLSFDYYMVLLKTAKANCVIVNMGCCVMCKNVEQKWALTALHSAHNSLETKNLRF